MTQSTNINQRVAIMVDGDNVSPAHAAWILQQGERLGQIVLARAYGDMTRGTGWHNAAAFHAVHSGTGKNATDILIAIDAVEFALTDVFDVIVLASSDGDFVHLARRLKQFGLHVVGVGKENTPDELRAACSVFHAFPVAGTNAPQSSDAKRVTELDLNIRKIIAAHSKNGSGIRIASLSTLMNRQYQVRISTFPERTWRAYLGARPHLYDLDPRGPDARVRFKPEGFQPRG